MAGSSREKGNRSQAGLHIVGRITVRSAGRLERLPPARKFISKAIKRFGLHELGSYYHKFPGGGFTGVVCLVESHLALHTWPELGWLTLDVYLCDYSRDNSEACRRLFGYLAGYFLPVRILKKEIKR